MDEKQILAYLLLGTLILGLVTFCVTYAFGSNWRSYTVGRYIMYFMATIAGSFAYIMVSPVVQDFFWKPYVDLAVLIALNYGAWKLTWLLRRIQKGKYQDEDTG